MSLHVLANHMASKGRGGDSMLVHMTPGEVETLQKMAEKLGGTLTINPETGLPEANFLKKMLPMIAGLALAPLTAGTSLAFLGATPFATALTVGGITGLATGSLSKGLMAGLGAYGGASLGASFAGAGTNALTNAGLANYGDTLAARDLVAGTAEYGEAASKLALESQAAASQAPFMDKIGAGFGQVTSSGPAALDFAKANKGPLAAAGMSYMAGQEPAKLDIPTTTQSPAMIRPMYSKTTRRDPNDPRYNPSGSVTGERNYFNTEYTVPEPYPAAANGGIVALADGGMSDEQLSSIGAYLATNPSASDLSAAMQQFGVSQADVDRARGQMAPAPANAFTQAQGNQYTIGGAELPQTPNPVLGNGLTEYQQGIVNAGQGVQWGSPQSEAEFVENYYAGSNAYDLTQAERLLGLAPQTMTGAVQNYQLGIGREKELAGRRAAGTDVSSSPYGGFSPAGQMAENERNEGIRAGTIPAPAPKPTAAPSPFTVGGVGMAMPHNPNEGMSLGSDFANAQPIPKPVMTEGVQTLLPARTEATDLSGTAAGAFVGPRGTVITYDNNGRQTDTGKPASALNDYLTGSQESGVGAFVRGLSWGVSPAEDQRSARALYDYAKSRGLSAEDIVRQSGVESGITPEQLKRQWAGYATQVTPPNQPPPVRVPPIYPPGAPVPGPEIIKPRDPYKPGTPIITPPPGRAPLPAPNVPVNPPKPPGWTGITGTPIPPRTPAQGGISALTTLSGDPYGLTPTAERFTPPTRTGRSQEIYDYLMGKTTTRRSASPASAPSPAPAPAPSPAPSPAPAPSGPPAASPGQQPTIDSIYTYVQSLGWGTPEADAKSLPLLSAKAAERGWTLAQLANATGFGEGALKVMFMNYGVTPPPSEQDQGGGYAYGGMTRMAGGGLGSLGGYSDGGQLLRGPGDGVSDDIPAIIGDRQPARLASGEFVVPARIVSELGNGSTEAGARSLYRMMDRVQAGRKKSIGKGKVAVDSRAEKYLPA